MPALVNVNFYGAPFVSVNPGELMTDIFGLSTCTAVWKLKGDSNVFSLLPMLMAHPLYPFTHMERRRVQISEGYYIVTGEFAGVDGGRSPSIYELCLGVADEPIETHPNFRTTIGGSPSNPLNGAIFIGPDGLPSDDDSIARFSYFNHSTNLVGIESYLAADQMTWRERYVINVQPTPGNVGHIDAPAGPAPSATNWLKISCNYEQRGLAYFVTNEWRASGRRAWNPSIY
jgi:hypothetical protein